MSAFDNSPNPFIELDLCKQELAEAYEFFAGADPEAQALVIEALDKKYRLSLHVAYDKRYREDRRLPPTCLALALRKR